MSEGEELSILLNSVLTEDMSIHAKPSCHNFIKHTPILLLYSFVHLIIVSLVEFFKLLTLETNKHVYHEETFCDKVRWIQFL